MVSCIGYICTEHVFLCTQILPSKECLLADFQEDVAGNEEPQLRRLINESEEVAGQREGIKKRLMLLQKASKEIAAFM